MIKLNNKTIGSAFLGSTPISKIYKGSQLVYEKERLTRISGNIQFTEQRDSITLFCNYWNYGEDTITVPLAPNGDFDFIIDESAMENMEITGEFNFMNMFYTRFAFNEDVTKVTINRFTANPERTNVTNNLISFSQMLFGADNLTEVNFNIDCSSLYQAFIYCPALVKVSIPKVTFDENNKFKFNGIFDRSPNINYIKCKQEVKDFFQNNVDFVKLPANMQQGGSGVWEIVD